MTLGRNSAVQSFTKYKINRRSFQRHGGRLANTIIRVESGKSSPNGWPFSIFITPRSTSTQKVPRVGQTPKVEADIMCFTMATGRVFAGFRWQTKFLIRTNFHQLIVPCYPITAKPTRPDESISGTSNPITPKPTRPDGFQQLFKKTILIFYEERNKESLRDWETPQRQSNGPEAP